ncbi:hypothetical protein GH741_12585 [Aquibacillus halophilus]|uniref:Uncharacterized protein n=1 Tax=Aquibacillus halophilus TaxID=930132 RepID=A0A6A8DG38_9BACI|nr:hypothetical protein [Aquibacillus halophilus]MRH43516.1 hypothetical protein [Aquibacillus halophilus]
MKTYWDLSYKKQFKFNLLLVPLVIVVIIWFLLSNLVPTFIKIIVITAQVVITVTTLLYTYIKSKKEEQNFANIS